MTRVYFAWSGLPDYAARCIRALIDKKVCEVQVIGTRPSVPIEGMEHSLGQKVFWINEKDKDVSFAELGLDRPGIFICGGYSVPAFQALTKICNRSKVPVILMADNIAPVSRLQLWAQMLRHRYLLSRKFAGIFVPGQAGFEYARQLGYDRASIETGLYSADPRLFSPGRALRERPKRLLFVGRLIERKNVLSICRSFERFAESNPEWELHICGEGVLKDRIPNHDRIVQFDFVQPSELSQMMRQARCLVLPSRQENFGLVVHEAALSGCALILSDKIGAGVDLARKDNACVVRMGDDQEMVSALRRMADWDETRWDHAGATSAALARQITPNLFANAVQRMIGRLGHLN